MDPQTNAADPTADLSSKSDDELKSLESDLVAQFDAADEADDLDTMSAVADQIDTVRAEMENRGGGTPEQENPAENAAEGGVEEPVTAAAEGGEAPAAEPTPSEAAPEQTDTPEQVDTSEQATEQPAGQQDDERADGPKEIAPDEGDTDSEEEPAEGDPKDTATAEGDDSATTEPEATTAGGSNKEEDVDIPEDRKPVAVTASNTIVAGTDIPGTGAGVEFQNRDELSRAFERRLDTVRRATSGDGEKHVVATILASADESRILEPGDIEGNLRKIEEVTRKEAITAAGGYCAPLETRYDIFGTGTTARPVRDALAGFQARRGGIRYTAAPKITDFDSAIGLWTAANDANPAMTDPDGVAASGDEFITPKAEMTVQCQPEQTALIDAVTLQLKFGNLATRAYPELIDRNNQLALVAHARYAERVLLNKLTALSVATTSSFKLGTARDFLNSLGRAATAYRHRYRMEPNQSLRVIAPIWVLDAMREDLAMQMPGDDTLALADAAIEAFIRSRNVNVSWHIDGTGFGDTVSAGALEDFPASFSWYIFAEGAFLFLDGGTLDLGIVRDSSLVSTNDYKTFTETFEGVARIGADSVQVTTTTRAAGATAGTVNTAA